MFYIGYKQDYTTACKKQLRDAEYIGTAANGAEVYSVVPDPNWADGRVWYYAMPGTVAGLCKKIEANPYATPEQMQERLAEITEEQAAKIFLDKDGELDRIREAISTGKWVSNGDALFCELHGEFALAEQTRAARAAYRIKREQERKEQEEREEKERQERAAAEQREHEQQLEQAERDLRAGKYITAANFEQLAEKYRIALPIKLVGWLREHCGSIRLEAHPECGGYSTQYYYDKGHKSTSIATYGDKLGKAMAI